MLTHIIRLDLIRMVFIYNSGKIGRMLPKLESVSNLAELIIQKKGTSKAEVFYLNVGLDFEAAN